MFDEDRLTSNFSTLYNDSAQVDNDFEMTLPNSFDDVTFGERSDADRTGSTTTGTRTMLSVRISAADGATTSTEAKMSDTWYGTDGDAVNNRSQYNACSNGDLMFEPVVNPGLSMNGIYTIKITNTVIGANKYIIEQAALAQVTANLGNCWELADHVVLCLPGGTSGVWIAYVYTNS